MLRCSSCRVDVVAKSNFMKMLCPNCGEEEIVRCYSCKASSVKYQCKKCLFTGP